MDDEERVVEFEVEGQQFRLELDSYAVSAVGAESREQTDTRPARSDEHPSPDGRWVVSEKEHDLWLQSTADSAETSDTFLAQTFVRVPNWQRLFTPLDDGEHFVWSSERDGWRHLCLYHLDGTLVRRLTQGLWPVIGWAPVEVRDG